MARNRRKPVFPLFLKACSATLILVLVCLPTPVRAMHISEGILPLGWAALWLAIALPFVAAGLRDLRRFRESSRHAMPLIGLVGAAVFVISCMPVPVPIAGSCSHPCGTGLAAILVGPFITVLITSIALLLQALFLAHGGLTTMGADICSMGVAGAFIGWGVFRIARAFRAPVFAAAFAAGLLSDWATYSATSLQLASALHGSGSLNSMFTALLLAFMPTQIPLGFFEGVITAGAYTFVTSRRPDLVPLLRVRNRVEEAK
jgi:cobalt/nickel transport system permease protein